MLALAAGVQVLSLPAFPARDPGGSVDAGVRRVQECRTAATAATTRSKGMGFSADTTTACQLRQGHEQVDLHQQYSDSVGT